MPRGESATPYSANHNGGGHNVLFEDATSASESLQRGRLPDNIFLNERGGWPRACTRRRRHRSSSAHPLLITPVGQPASRGCFALRGHDRCQVL